MGIILILSDGKHGNSILGQVSAACRICFFIAQRGFLRCEQMGWTPLSPIAPAPRRDGPGQIDLWKRPYANFSVFYWHSSPLKKGQLPLGGDWVAMGYDCNSISGRSLSSLPTLRHSMNRSCHNWGVKKKFAMSHSIFECSAPLFFYMLRTL